MYNVSVKKILEWNKLHSQQELYVGRRIAVVPQDSEENENQSKEHGEQ